MAGEEDKFDFDAAGEAREYTSLGATRRHAHGQGRTNYGQRLAGVGMVYEVVKQEEGEDYYEITMSFRPRGISPGPSAGSSSS